jgi:hypothetical protein
MVHTHITAGTDAVTNLPDSSLSEINSTYNNQLDASLGPGPAVSAFGTHINSKECESNSFYGNYSNVCYDELSEDAKKKLTYKNNRGCSGAAIKIVERLKSNCTHARGGRSRRRTIIKSKRRQNRRKMKTRRRKM